MQEVPQRLRPNQEEVAAKVIDGEAILINLSTGVYYSMDGTGGRIWSLIERRHELEEIADTLATEYGEPRERCRADVQRLARQLLDENLVLAADEGAPADAARAEESSSAANGAGPYAEPELNIYRDMGDLLALDPPVPGLEPIPWSDPDRSAP